MTLDELKTEFAGGGVQLQQQLFPFWKKIRRLNAEKFIL